MGKIKVVYFLNRPCTLNVPVFLHYTRYKFFLYLFSLPEMLSLVEVTFSLFLFLAQSEGRYQESLDKCKHTLKRIEDLPEGSLKNKPDVIANLYNSMGNAYLEMNKFSLALKYHTKDLNAARDKYVLSSVFIFFINVCLTFFFVLKSFFSCYCFMLLHLF